MKLPLRKMMDWGIVCMSVFQPKGKKKQKDDAMPALDGF